MTKLKFEMENHYDEIDSAKTVREITTQDDAYIEEVILEFVNFLKGCTYSVELIQQYINYEIENHEVLKIGE